MINVALRTSLYSLVLAIGPASWCVHNSQLSGMHLGKANISKPSSLEHCGTAELQTDAHEHNTIYDFTVKNIQCAEVALRDYAGKVIVVVNVASKCGYTPQYEALQALYEEHKDAGLVILGFPCNQFGGQEPGTHEEIKEFCKVNYGVKFDLFSKVDVNGDDRAPLYNFLTEQATEPKGAGDVQWNFEKFVIDRSGGVAARFGTKVKPESKEFKATISELLEAAEEQVKSYEQWAGVTVLLCCRQFEAIPHTPLKPMDHRLSYTLFLVLCLLGTSPAAGQGVDMKSKNTVIVMGMIHGNHRQPGPYDLEHLRQLIREIKPDYVLTEIPPGRYAEAAKQFRENGEITESRVRVFPEYTDALFPLTEEMEFQIVPCAAWTREMSDSRQATLAALRSTHADEYAEMQFAQTRASEAIAALGDTNDPAIIHTEQYDEYVKKGMEPYDRHFNDIIGAGGWTNINAGHYALIEDVLDSHSGEGKRFLVTFGSWHKYYIKEQLRKRSDIKLVSVADYLDQSQRWPTNWPRFRLNSSNGGAYGSTEIAKPTAAWKYSTGDIIESSPAVVDGVAYVGGHAKRLHAIDMNTGKLKWQFNVGGWVRASPSIVDNVVYFGADDNKFYAVDADTGKKKWEFALGDGGEQSSPVIDDGVVYFGAFDGHVYAIDALTGAHVWKYDVGDGMLSSPAITSEALFIGTNGGQLVSINRKTGQKIWSFQANDSPIFSSPNVLHSVVTFGSYDGSVYALNADDGTQIWKTQTNGEIFSSPAVVGERLYIGSNDHHLYALEFASGAVAWRTDLNGAVFSSPAVTDETVYVGSSDGHMYALNRNDGSHRWRYEIGKDVKVWTSPVAIGGVILFGSHAGDLIALTTQTESNTVTKE